MSDYLVLTNFAAKDALATGNAGKRILGTEVAAEFTAIAAAVATKYDDTDRGAASGIAPLDSSSLLPVANLPITVPQVSSGSFTPTWAASGGGSIGSVAGDWWYQKYTYTLGGATYALVVLQPSHTGVTLTGTITGTVNYFYIDNLPAAITPQDASVTVPVLVYNNGATELGYVTLTTAGDANFYRGTSAAYTAAATGGLGGTGPQIVYSFRQDIP